MLDLCTDALLNSIQNNLISFCCKDANGLVCIQTGTGCRNMLCVYFFTRFMDEKTKKYRFYKKYRNSFIFMAYVLHYIEVRA